MLNDFILRRMAAKSAATTTASVPVLTYNWPKWGENYIHGENPPFMSTEYTDYWGAVNAVILSRWSMSGLNHIKEQAWKLVQA